MAEGEVSRPQSSKQLTTGMSFYAFAIMALAFEKAQRYHEEKKREKARYNIRCMTLGKAKFKGRESPWVGLVQVGIDFSIKFD